LNKAIREVLDWVIIIAIAFGASYALRHWVVQPYRIQMSSMETTVFPNDLVMVDKVSYDFHQPREVTSSFSGHPALPLVIHISSVSLAFLAKPWSKGRQDLCEW